MMDATPSLTLAPELVVSRWFNIDTPVSLESLRGYPVLLHTFQMLCPGCVAHAMPQAQRIAAMLRPTDLVVIGLHTVFEHHLAMTPVSLEAFLHEYRISFPVGVDAPGEPGPIPKTMAAYGFRGTPSTVLIDRKGFIRHHGFGQEDDTAMGLRLGMLLAENAGTVATSDDNGAISVSECRDGACRPKGQNP